MKHRKTIKRLWSFMLAIVMVFGMTMTSFAADGDTTTAIEFTSSNDAPKVGDEFEVTANITSNTGFNAFEMTLTYNQDTVEFKGFKTEYSEDAEEDVLVTDFATNSLITVNDEEAIFTLARSSNTAKTGTLFIAKFEVINAGDCEIGYDADKLKIASDSVAYTITPDFSAVENLTATEAPAATYEVTLPTGTGYTAAAYEGSSSPVAEGGSYSFTVTVSSGYKKGDSFAVKANGTSLTENNGIYTIENITEAQTITVEGVEADVAAAGYTVSLTPDMQDKLVGETAEVKVNVASGDSSISGFNTLYTELTYDTDYLTLTTDSVEGYTITDTDGSVVIVGYGENKDLGDAITLSFEVIARPTDGTDVELTQAKVDVSANADVQDAPEASYGDKTATITVSSLTVTYPEDKFTGDTTVTAGDDYTFTAKDPNYDYTFNATMGENSVTVVDKGDGTYTVKEVTDDLTIEVATETPKSFDVTIENDDKDQITADDKATYKTDYTFTVDELEGYNTTVTVTIGGESYPGYSVSGDTYTIPGDDITGEIVITVSNEASEYKVTFEGNAAGAASADKMSVSNGDSFTFKVEKKTGYNYTISATMGGTACEHTDNGDDTYTIEKVTGDLVITINKEEIVPDNVEVAVYQYVKVDDFVIYLVTASSDSLAEGKVLSYDGDAMYWSSEYDAYAYLVISDEVLTEDTAAALVAAVTGTSARDVDYTGDVNSTDVIDVNDAQLVYDIYNAKYQSFDDIFMWKVLNADVNGSYDVTVADAAAVVNTILN